MPHRLLLRLLEDEESDAYGRASTSRGGIGMKTFEDELLELSTFLASDSKPWSQYPVQETVVRQPSSTDRPVVQEPQQPVQGQHLGPLRCLETFHPDCCRK